MDGLEWPSSPSSRGKAAAAGEVMLGMETGGKDAVSVSEGEMQQ